MSGVKITIDPNLSDWAREFRTLGSDMSRRVMSDALNKAGEKARTDVKRALVKSTGLPYREISSGMRTTKSTPATLTFTITENGREHNLRDFKARWLRPGVKAQPWGHSKLFPGTFQIKRWGSRVFRRVGASRLPIEGLWGPNPAREMIKREPLTAFTTVSDNLVPQIINQLKRRLP
jgi:hypothetical protein